MATFAKLADDGKTVVNIITVDVAKTTKNNQINEEVGQGALYRNHGWPAELWKISEIDAFIHPKPHPSWILNETTCKWEAPIPRPDDDKVYEWDEENQAWVAFVAQDPE